MMGMQVNRPACHLPVSTISQPFTIYRLEPCICRTVLSSRHIRDLETLKDDPAHVNERNVGATPPAVYDLKPRERLFHGVQALRMIPVEGDATLGRAGLLAHSYMLGSAGDSNGCVSIKDYDKFLAAFQKGEIKRLVVVTSLTDASRRPMLKS